MIIRKASAEECKAVYDLICDMENSQLEYGKFEEIFLLQLSDDRYCCLVGKESDTVIAVLNLRIEEQLHHADRIAEIMECAVHPAWRDQGVGGKMLEEAEKIGREQGCCQIEVACNQMRSGAHRFYLKNGMHNFHYKFSKGLYGEDEGENRLGR